MARILLIRPIQPTAIEQSWYREIRDWTRQWDDDVKLALDNIPFGYDENRYDALSDDIAAWITSATRRSSELLSRMVSNSAMANLGAEIGLHGWRNWVRQVKRSPEAPELPSVAPWQERGIVDRVNSWIDRSTRTLTGFEGSRKQALQDLIERGVTGGWSRRALKREILSAFTNDELTGLPSGRRMSPEARADLIATDQVLTLSAELHQQRMLNGDVRYYIWRSMEDGRVRPLHVKQDGMYFRTDGLPMTAADFAFLGITTQTQTTPGDGQPGQPVRCRCYREPVWKGSEYDD